MGGINRKGLPKCQAVALDSNTQIHAHTYTMHTVFLFVCMEHMCLIYLILN